MRSWLIWALARSWVGRKAVGILFSHFAFALPIHRLRETDTLIAFEHPQPSYAVHILVVPKRPLTNLLDLQAVDAPLLMELVATVQSLVQERQLEPAGYRLITNGGAYQEIPHLHFHLVSGPPH